MTETWNAGNPQITNQVAADIPDIEENFDYLMAMNGYWVDSSESDQGAAGSGNSIKDLVDSIGSSKEASLFIKHHAADGNTTTYTLNTSETITSNIETIIQKGAIINGSGTLTINGPFKAGPYQVFGTSITVVFGGGSVDKVYPQWWGAASDGSTDDTTALTSAATAATGHVLYFPRGTSYYLVTDPGSSNPVMEVGNNTRVEFESGAEIRLTGSTACIILTNDDWSGGNSNIHVIGNGGVIDGNNRTLSSSDFDGGVVLRRVENCSVKGMLVKDTSGPAINIERPGGYIVVDGNFIDGDPGNSGTPTGCDGAITVQDSVDPGPSEIVITNNVIQNCLEGIGCNAASGITNSGRVVISNNTLTRISTADGITFAGYSKFVCQGNTIYRTFNSGIAARLYLGNNSQGGCISGNYIERAGYDATAAEDAHGIKIGRTTSTNDGYFTISGNTIIDSGNATAGGDGIRVSINCSNIAITGNTIDNANEYGIDCQGTSGNEISNMAINGNVVNGCGKAGIYAVYTDYLAITGNVCFDNGSSNTNPNGIQVEACDYFTINGNTCSDEGTYQDYGLKLATSPTFGVIVGNNFEGNNTGAFTGYDNLSSGIIANNGPNSNVYETFTAASGNLSGIFPTLINSSSNGVDATLPDGTLYGQHKLIVMSEASNSSTVTVTHHNGGDAGAYTFDAVDEGVLLMWTYTEWVEIATFGGIGAYAP